MPPKLGEHCILGLLDSYPDLLSICTVYNDETTAYNDENTAYNKESTAYNEAN